MSYKQRIKAKLELLEQQTTGNQGTLGAAWFELLEQQGLNSWSSMLKICKHVDYS